NFISTKVFATEEIVSEYGIGVGDDVFMVGRFINHEGSPTYLPATRFGNISVMPFPILKSPQKGPSYCIDMHSRPGFSGSPVFVYRTPGGNLDVALKTGKVFEST